MHTLVFTNIHDLTHAFCEYLKRHSTETLTKQEKYFLALSGGSTPGVLYETLVKDYRNSMAWDKFQFFWGDERCVPPDHTESNYRMAKDLLFNRLSIPKENIHRIQGENIPASEVKRYEKLIMDLVPTRNGKPSFDLILLGAGEDGHTASIFPDRPDLLKSADVCATAVHPASQQTRITLTGGVIAAAGSICFLVSGRSKRAVMEGIITGTEQAKKFPAWVIGQLPQVQYFCDKDALPG